MSESFEIIRNEFSMCENPLDVLACQTCPEKAVKNEASVPTIPSPVFPQRLLAM